MAGELAQKKYINEHVKPFIDGELIVLFDRVARLEKKLAKVEENFIAYRLAEHSAKQAQPGKFESHKAKPKKATKKN